MTEPRPDVTPAAWLMPAAFHASILLGLFGRVVYFGPRFVQTFQDFQLALPAWSKAVTEMTRWVAAYWPVALVVLLAVIAANSLVLWRLGGLRRRAGWLWTWMGGGAWLTVWMVIELGYLLPMMKLQEGLDR